MRQSWMRNIFLFSAVMVSLASCKDPEFSLDEPLTLPERKAIYICGQNNFLHALDPNTGEKIWEKFFGINNILQEPIILRDYCVVNTEQGILRLDAKSGKVIDTIREIEFSGAKHTPTGMISGMDATLYTGTTSNHFVALNITAKAPVWVSQNTITPALAATGSFFGNQFIAQYDNKLHALNRNAAGAAAWTYTLPGPINDPVISSPYVYVLEKNGTLHALDINNGTEVWNFPTGEATESSPIVYGGNIIYGTMMDRLYCIDPIARAPRWVYQADERIGGSAYAYDQTVYFGCYDHYFYALNIIDGEIRWRYRTGGLINSSPVVTNGIAYIGSYDQHMYAFDTTGAMKWKYKVNALINKTPVVNNLDNRPVYAAPVGLSSQ